MSSTIHGRRAARRAWLATLAAIAAATVPVGAWAEDAIAEVTFTCADDKSIDATFYADKVDLKLSDGRSMSLPQTMSGSGIRYADADETVVFWSKGDTAFVTEGSDSEETYSDCVTAK